MIDTKMMEELQSKRTELDAEARVYSVIGEFILANVERCKRERNFSECQAWIDAMDDVNKKLEIIHSEYCNLIEQVK